MNSDTKIRSHQRLVTPPEGGSFRQLTSTRRKREKCIQILRTEKMQTLRGKKKDNTTHKH